MHGLKGYAVELYLEPAAEAAVRSVWADLSAAGFVESVPPEGARPHVSLAVFDTLDEPSARARVASLAQEIAPFEVRLGSVGVFPGDQAIVFFAPVVTAELLDLHARLHGQFREAGEAEWPYYRPGRWVPHCTLATAVPADRVGEAVALCRKAPLPLDTRFAGIELIHFRPISTLCTYALRTP